MSKTLTLFKNGGFSLAEFVPYENTEYVLAACCFPIPNRDLVAQIESAQRQGIKINDERAA